jgi:hypothetical protein
MVSIDNDIVGAFFNGTPIAGFVPHDGCPILDEFSFDVPQSLVQSGQNLVAFHVLDRGAESFFDARILAELPAKITVEIDIKPGSFPNTINPTSEDVIPVAVLTTNTFAATTLDPTTVRFGRTGTEAAPVHSALEDVDGDGDTDMILHFNTHETAIQCGDTLASLAGKTFDGQMIQGSNSITTVGCK